MMPCVRSPPSGYPARMDSDRAVPLDPDEDRVVSRRVSYPASAEPADEAAYAAADPPAEPDVNGDPGGTGGESDRAAHDLAGDNESEPTRSE